MTFLYPERLLLLCIPAILCWWLVRRRGTEIKLPMDGVKTPSYAESSISKYKYSKCRLAAIRGC